MSDIKIYWKDRNSGQSVPHANTYKFLGKKNIKIYELIGNIDECNINLYVSEEFYYMLTRPPLKLEKDHNKAYIFGNFFPAESYELLGYHMNEANQTGILDVTNMIREEEFDWYHTDIFDKLKLPWDDEKNRDIYRTETPRILFLGHTFINSGVAIYAHSTNNIMDSLIIDDNYCYNFLEFT